MIRNVCPYFLLAILCCAASHGFSQDLMTALPLVGHENGVLDTSIETDSQLLASASSDHTVRIWSLPQRQQLALLQHDNVVKKVQFLGKDKLVTLMLSGESAQPRVPKSRKIIRPQSVLCFWDLQTSKIFMTIDDLAGSVVGMDTSDDGKWVAILIAGDGSKGTMELRLVDAAGQTHSSYQWTRTKSRTYGGEQSVRFFPDSSRIAIIGSLEGHDKCDRVSILDLQQGNIVHCKAVGQVAAAAVAPDGQSVAAILVPHRDAKMATMLQVWNAQTGEEISKSDALPVFMDRVECLTNSTLAGRFWREKSDAINANVATDFQGVLLFAVPSRESTLVSSGEIFPGGDFRGSPGLHQMAVSENGTLAASLRQQAAVLKPGSSQPPLHLEWNNNNQGSQLKLSSDGNWLVGAVDAFVDSDENVAFYRERWLVRWDLRAWQSSSQQRYSTAP